MIQQAYDVQQCQQLVFPLLSGEKPQWWRRTNSKNRLDWNCQMFLCVNDISLLPSWFRCFYSQVHIFVFVRKFASSQVHNGSKDTNAVLLNLMSIYIEKPSWTFREILNSAFWERLKNSWTFLIISLIFGVGIVGSNVNHEKYSIKWNSVKNVS